MITTTTNTSADNFRSNFDSYDYKICLVDPNDYTYDCTSNVESDNVTGCYSDVIYRQIIQKLYDVLNHEFNWHIESSDDTENLILHIFVLNCRYFIKVNFDLKANQTRIAYSSPIGIFTKVISNMNFEDIIRCVSKIFKEIQIQDSLD